jgi:TM2 domain-containing membrane protein YozV
MKSKKTAYLLCIFLGFWGIHRFYLGKIKTGILYFFTLGLFGVGWLYDLITLSRQVDKINGAERGNGPYHAKAPANSPQSERTISPSNEEIMFGDLVAETNTTVRIKYETDDGILSERTVDVKKVLASSRYVY